MMFSAVSGVSPSVSANSTVVTPVSQVAVTPTTTPAHTNANVKSYVAEYFSDIPVMVNIAYCESRDRQYEPDGSVFENVPNTNGTVDIGVMQINDIHTGNASDENYNLNSVEGNTAYARKLYEKYGTAPWNSSKQCWGNMPTDGNNDQVATNIK